MNVETIYTLPTLTRNEEKGTFEYPDKYVGKLFQFNNEYIYFRKRSYETCPKDLIETVIKGFLEENPIEIPNPDIDINKVYEQINSKDEEISNQFAKLSDKLQVLQEDKVSLNDLEQFKISIQEQINSYVENLINDEKVSSIISQKINEVTEQNSSSLDLNQIVDKKLDKIYETLEETIDKRLKENPNVSTNDNSNNVPISIMQLSILKEAGYTVEEIVELRNNNLI